MLTVTHSVASLLPLGSRNVRFLHAAFDAEGDRFIAGDCHGNVFLFDIRANKYEDGILIPKVPTVISNKNDESLYCAVVEACCVNVV